MTTAFFQLTAIAARTRGDIFAPIGAFVYRWMELPIERPSMPQLERYFELLKQRPGYRTHVMIGIE